MRASARDLSQRDENVEIDVTKARHWLGDAGLAVLLALPTATLANPSAAIWHARPTIAAVTPQVQLPAEKSRFGFPG